MTAPTKGKAPNEDQKFYLDWAKEQYKESSSLVLEFLRLLTTLNVALITAGILFQNKNNGVPCLLTGYFVLIFLALMLCLYGVMPRLDNGGISDPARIREKTERLLRSRVNISRLSAILMFFGLLLGALAMSFTTPHNSTEQPSGSDIQNTEK